MEEIIKKADVLIEALPYIRRFRHKTIVIKYGGSAMLNEAGRKGVLEDLIFMYCVGMRPLIVHGGGPFINQHMQKQGRKATFVDGLRVTDEETIRIVEEVLSSVNKMLVDEIRSFGVKARGYNPRKDKLITAKKAPLEVDIGYVGQVVKVSADLIKEQLKAGFIPVIFSLAMGPDRKIYNINADEVSAEIAGALKAEKLVLLTDVKGIMRNVEDESSLIPSLRIDDIETLIKNNVVSSGMIPKVKAGVKAVRVGVKKVHIISARIPHALLLEIFTDKGIGSEIVK